MVLPWSRRERTRQTQQRTEDQLSTSTAQLMQVGEIIGRLNAVASRFETIASKIVEVVDCPEEQHGNGKDGGAAR